MSDLTVDDWLNLAPCPPPSNPGLLYWTPYPVNLTESEVRRIAERCDVPPKNKLILSSSFRSTSGVLLPFLVSLLSLPLLGIAVLVYRYKYKKQIVCDSCLLSMDSQHNLLEDMHGRGYKGCDNDTYKEPKTHLYTKQDLQNSRNPAKHAKVASGKENREFL